MIFNLCGSNRFRAYTTKAKDRVFVENLHNRALFEVKTEDWDEFYNFILTANKRVKDLKGDL